MLLPGVPTLFGTTPDSWETPSLSGNIITSESFPRGDFFDQRIDRSLHGARRLVAALVGDDEDAKIVLGHDVDVALRPRYATMMRMVDALQPATGNDFPEVADAELRIERDQRAMRLLYHRPVGQLEPEVLHHFRDSCLHVP